MKCAKITRIRLSNGVYIPILGIGPGILGRSMINKNNSSDDKVIQLLKRIYSKFYRINFTGKYVEAISHSLQIGFTLLDYSSAYGNEHLIGKSIKKSVF